MPPETANRRFLRVMIPCMAGFVLTSAALAFVAEPLGPPPAALYLLSVVPIVLLILPFWALWRLVGEIDEFLRLLQLRGIIAGLTVVMVTASAWGFLEAYAHAPALPVFWLNPLFWAAYGAGVMIATKRATGRFE